MSSVRRRQPYETRARLLAAGRTTLASRGYLRCGVGEICRAAGVSVGSFYVYFEDKPALAIVLLQQEHEHFLAAVTSMDLRQRSSVEATLESILAGPNTRLYRAMQEAGEVEPRVAEVFSALRDASLTGLAAAVERARGHRGPADFRLDARSVAWTFLALQRDAIAANACIDGAARRIASVVCHSAFARREPSA